MRAASAAACSPSRLAWLALFIILWTIDWASSNLDTLLPSIFSSRKEAASSGIAISLVCSRTVLSIEFKIDSTAWVADATTSSYSLV